MLIPAETYTLPLPPWMPAPEQATPPEPPSIFVNSYDALGLQDSVSWRVRITEHGSAYCSVVHPTATLAETWYSLQGPEIDPLTVAEFCDLDHYSLYYGLEALARRNSSQSAHNTGIHDLISSKAVSMAGHLRYLIPTYEQDSLEAQAKTKAIHFESVTLALEHGRLNRFSSAIQTLSRFGRSICTILLQKRLAALSTPYWRTFSSCVCRWHGIEFAAQV